MILSKLQEALAEVSVQRAALDDVESQLRSMIARLSGVAIAPHHGSTANVAPVYSVPTPEDKRDKFDAITDILRAEGKPLHITMIAERLSAQTGTKVDRTSIEPGINRHIAKVQRRRIEKFGPSTFGLPEWKLPSVHVDLTPQSQAEQTSARQM